MIPPQVISEVTKRLVETYHPLKIYLFGSYAWGTPTDDSDLDLMVIIKESADVRYKRAIPGRLALYGLGIAKDLIVLTEEEFATRSLDETKLAYVVKNHGKLLYAES